MKQLDTLHGQWLATAWLCLAGLAGGLPAALAEVDGAIPGELLHLGQIQVRSGEYDQALDQFKHAVEMIESESGPWDDRLVPALVGEGDAMFALGDYGGALDVYGRAQHIARINDGLHSLRQLPILDRLTETYAALNDWNAAADQQQYALRLAIREYGESGVGLLPALQRAGAWHQRTGNVFAARSIYERMIEIIEQAWGPDDLRLVEPLQLFAGTFRAERLPTGRSRPTEPLSVDVSDPVANFNAQSAPPGLINRYSMGEAALQRAKEIYAKQRPDDIDGRLDTILKLGDWFLVFDKWPRAEDQYREAVALRASAGTDVPPILDQPEPLFVAIHPLPAPPPWSTASDLRDGHIELTMDVTERGFVRNVQVTDADPPGMMEVRVKRAMKTARFRPRFDASGEPVRSNGVTYRHVFKYYASGRDVDGTTADAGDS